MKNKKSIIKETIETVKERKVNYGRMDGSQKGWKEGGRGRNKTLDCRHPELKKRRQSQI